MPVIEPVNTQQVLQMGGHVERLQQVMQHLHETTMRQLDDERARLDTARQSEVQDSQASSGSEPTDPERQNRSRGMRIKKKGGAAASTPPPPEPSPAVAGPRDSFLPGANIDLKV